MVAAAAMDITEVTVVHHAALVLLALWAAVSAGWAHPAIFLAALLYLFAVSPLSFSFSLSHGSIRFRMF